MSLRTYNPESLEENLAKSWRDMPIMVSAETNTVCTRKCYYCPRLMKENLVMDSGIFYSIVNQLKESGYNGIFALNGYNEPLTDKRMSIFIDYARKRLSSSIIRIYTNGDLLDENKVKEFLLAGVSEFKVTLHEPTSLSRESRLKELANKYSQISILDLRDASRETPLSNIGGLVKLRQITKISDCRSVNVMVIRADGNVTLCCKDARKRHTFGNVKNEGLISIWNNGEYQTLRQEIREGIYNLTACQECGYEKRE